MEYRAPENGFRTFLIVWGTQSVSVIGSALTYFAMIIWVNQVLYPAPEQKTDVALALSSVSLALVLPTLFAMPIAGAWADRHDRKQTMMVTDVISGCLSVVLAGLIISQKLELGMLVGLVAVHSFTNVFHQSAFDASYSMIVPEKMLPRANGMMQTIWSLSGIISPALGAIIISLPVLARQGTLAGGIGEWLARWNDGTPLAIALDAVTFFLAGASLLFLQIPSPKRSDLTGAGRKSIRADVKEGALYIWHRRPMLWLLGTFALVNLVASPLGVLEPMLVKYNLAADGAARGFTFETGFALLSSITSIGGVVGGLSISAWGGLKRRRVYGVLVAMVVYGVAMIGLGMSAMLYLSSALGFVMASMLPIMNTHSQTIWQTQTPRELQGRVFAVRRLIAQFTLPLGVAAAGWLGGQFNPGIVIAAMGAIMVVFCGAQLFNPSFLRVEDKQWLDALAARAAGE